MGARNSKAIKTLERKGLILRPLKDELNTSLRWLPFPSKKSNNNIDRIAKVPLYILQDKRPIPPRATSHHRPPGWAKAQKPSETSFKLK